MGTREERAEVRAAIRALMEKENAGGALHGVAAYVELFPGFRDLVDEEHAAVRARGGWTVTSGPPSACPSPTRMAPGAADTEPSAAQDPEPSGDRIGPYRIVRELGRGGMGVVYEARDTRLSRRVALKVLNPQFATSNHLRLRFQREAELASGLDHPHICTVYEAGEDGGTPYLAMRFVEGRPLSDLVAATRERRATDLRTACVVHLPSEVEGEGSGTPDGSGASAAAGEGSGRWGARKRNAVGARFELERVLLLFERAARALHHAHERGLIHRDIKPNNIMVTAAGDPVLLDFGLAREEAGEGHRLTQTGSLMGTPAYMSPEQLAAQRIHLDRRTDVYSTGVALYECLTLQLPFEAPTLDRLYQRILASEPEDPRRLNRDLPEDLVVVLETAMEKDRDRRYGSAADLAEDLRRVRMHEPIRARPAGRLLRVRRWVQRNRAVSVLLGVLALGLAGATAVLRGMLVEREARLQAQAFLDDQRAFRREALAEVRRQTAESMAPVGPDSDARPRRAFLFPRTVFRSTDEREVWWVQLPAEGEPALFGTSVRSPGARLLDVDVFDQFAGFLVDSAGAESRLAEGVSPSGRGAILLAPDGSGLLCTGADGARLVGWDGAPRARFDEGPTEYGLFSGDGSRVVTVGADGRSRLWETDGRLLAEFPHGVPGGRLHVVLDDSGRRLLTHELADGTVRLWSDTGERLWEFRPPERILGEINGAWLFPAGDSACVVHQDGTAAILDGAGRPVATLSPEEGGARIAVRTSGRSVARVTVRGDAILAACRDGITRLWDGAGRLVGKYPGIEGDLDPAKRCVATVLDGRLHLWGLDGAPLLSVRPGGGGGSLMSVRFHGTPGILITEQVGLRHARDFMIWDCFLDYR